MNERLNGVGECGTSHRALPIIRGNYRTIDEMIENRI